MEISSKLKGYNESRPGSLRFAELRTYKEEKLIVARECSALTKPRVVPPSGATPGSSIVHPQQSHGARLVSNLVSQLLLILFPPGVPCFKLDLASVDMRNLSKTIKVSDVKSMHDALRETFVSIENNSTILLDTANLREKLQMIIQQLVVAGNSLFLTANDKLEILPMEDWVCSRSASGDLLEVVFKQVFPVTPKLILELGITEASVVQGSTTVYTRCFRKDDKWQVEKFTDGAVRPYASVTVTDDNFWVQVPYWELASGEDYGTGPVEESLGDLRTYESGTAIIKESATALAKVIFTVRPNGVTKATDVASAENTEIISGDAADVGVIQANKVYDMSGFIQYLEGIKRELDITFMMPSVIRREAERVTAEEIRMMANEFEKSKGGTYNTMARHVQTPVARLIIKILFKQSTSFGSLTLGDLLPVVTTGLQGLGRTLELENLRAFLADATGIPEIKALIKFPTLARKLAILRGLEISDLFKTTEEMTAESEQTSMDTMAQRVGPEMIKGAMNQ